MRGQQGQWQRQNMKGVRRGVDNGKALRDGLRRGTEAQAHVPRVSAVFE